MKNIQRPTVTVNRVFSDKRSAIEAFAAVLVKEIQRRSQSVRTFEAVKKPDYNFNNDSSFEIESEEISYDTADAPKDGTLLQAQQR